MIKNYLTVAWRNLLRNRIFSLINITGLAIGLSVCFLITQYVQFERSYDRFHEKADRIYRVPISYDGNFEGSTATNHPAVGPAMKADFPEVQEASRLGRASLFGNAWALSYEDRPGNRITFNEDNIYVADAPFLTMFSFPMKAGDAATALKEPNSVVITEKVAHKYFHNESALGKQLKVGEDLTLKVTGVLKDLPENSHLQFDILVSMVSLGEKWGEDVWGWPEFYNYVLLAPGADPARVEAKFPDFVAKYLTESMRLHNFKAWFYLQPLTSIHLTSHIGQEQQINGNERTVYFLTLLAFFVLVIARINYINLSTAKSLERAKEVGMRKVAGASKWQLIFQFFFDASLINLLSIVVAAFITTFSLPLFDEITGKNISDFVFTSGIWGSPSFWIITLAVFLVSVALVGLYPALVLSSFRPVLVLKGRFYKSPSGAFIRKCMVSFQYVLSVFLIAGTVTIFLQLSYMQKTDMGYAMDQVLVLNSPGVYDSSAFMKLRAFKNELKKLSAVSDVTNSTDIPGKAILDRNNMRRENQDPGESFTTYIQGVDPDFFQTFDMELLAGRTFQENETMGLPFGEIYQNNREFEKEVKVLINEKAAANLGYESPEDAVHQKINFLFGQGGHPAEIIGVVKNYHQRSLRSGYEPILYFVPAWGNWKYTSLRVNTHELASTLASIEKIYQSSFGYSTIEYFFLDDSFNRQHNDDRQFGVIFGTFTILAIVVACLGLLGLSVFATTQRIKEIGIRKVLGSSFGGIVVLFSKDSVRLLAISYLVAVPVIYIAVNSWLSNFAFHISMRWEIFTLPPVLLLLISTMTVCVVCFRAAMINPGSSLRHE